MWTKDKLSLNKNDIHLWFIKPQELLSEPDLLTQYSDLLTPEELVKQQRYKFANDRHDALVTRAFVRDLLSYYADIKPQDWLFEKGSKGKPEIVNAPLPLRFNLSHTKNLIVCAVTLTNDIGCDVENTARSNDVTSIAKRYFSKQETDELFTLAQSEQRSRFFDYWTLKEAYIKAWGLGLSIPLADFSFHINDHINEHTNEHTGDTQALTNSAFLIKSDIRLSFAQHREDNPDIWRNWLLYPNKSIDEQQEHRIALSLRAKEHNQQTQYQIKTFQSLPLSGYQIK